MTSREKKSGGGRPNSMMEEEKKKGTHLAKTTFASEGDEVKVLWA